MENIQPYRQPLVTATGILLGFMLNFATAWIPGAFQQNTIRILKMRYPKENAEKYYSKTLVMFIIGASIPFIMVFIVMIENFITHKTL